MEVLQERPRRRIVEGAVGVREKNGVAAVLVIDASVGQRQEVGPVGERVAARAAVQALAQAARVVDQAALQLQGKDHTRLRDVRRDGHVRAQGARLAAVRVRIVPVVIADILVRTAVVGVLARRRIRPHVRVEGAVIVIVAVQADARIECLDALEIDHPLQAIARHGVVVVIFRITVDELLAQPSRHLDGGQDAPAVGDRHGAAARIHRIDAALRRDFQALHRLHGRVGVLEALVVRDAAVGVERAVVEGRQRYLRAGQVRLQAEFALLVALPDQTGIVGDAARHHEIGSVDHVVRVGSRGEHVDIQIGRCRIEDGEGRLLDRHAPAAAQREFAQESALAVLLREEGVLGVETRREAGGHAVGGRRDHGVVPAHAGDEVQPGVVARADHQVLLGIGGEVRHRGHVAVAPDAVGLGRGLIFRISTGAEVLVQRPVRTDLQLAVDAAHVLRPVRLQRHLGAQRTVIDAQDVVARARSDAHRRIRSACDIVFRHVVAALQCVQRGAADRGMV